MRDSTTTRISIRRGTRGNSERQRQGWEPGRFDVGARWMSADGRAARGANRGLVVDALVRVPRTRHADYGARARSARRRPASGPTDRASTPPLRANARASARPGRSVLVPPTTSVINLRRPVRLSSSRCRSQGEPNAVTRDEVGDRPPSAGSSRPGLALAWCRCPVGAHPACRRSRSTRPTR